MRHTIPILKTWITSLLFGGILLLFSCAQKTDSKDLIHSKASLPARFDFEKLGFKVINSSINKKSNTMSTLYGNEKAVLRLRTTDITVPSVDEKLALITWKQKEDEHWFGAKIPSEITSIEFVNTLQGKMGGTFTGYQKYEGQKEIFIPDTLYKRQRMAYILSQKASVMP